MFTSITATAILAFLPAVFTAAVPRDDCLAPLTIKVGPLGSYTGIIYYEDSYPHIDRAGVDFNITNPSGETTYCSDLMIRSGPKYFQAPGRNITCAPREGEPQPSIVTNFTYVEQTDPKVLGLYSTFECGGQKYVAGGEYPLDVACTESSTGTLGEPYSSYTAGCRSGAYVDYVSQRIELVQ